MKFFAHKAFKERSFFRDAIFFAKNEFTEL